MAINRRQFVSSTAAGLVTASAALTGRRAAAAPSSAQSRSNVAGANDRIRVGYIGVGGMGRAHLNNFQFFPETQSVVVCDVWPFNVDRAVKMTANQRGGPAEGVKDFRRVLDRQDLDVVVIATPDHWHAIPAVLACQAGKDVYVEKPISLNIREGRKMVDAARAHKRIVQVGTQQRSGAHFKEAVQIVRDGKLGQVTRVATWNYGAGNLQGIGNPPDGQPPDGLDYDFWLGPAPKRPFNDNRFIFNFRWFWDYAGGMMTDWGVHLIDIVQWAMNVDAPRAVTAVGAKYAIKDNRETPDTIDAFLEYPTFICSYSNRVLNGRSPNNRGYGIEFYGTEGTLFVDRAGYELTPEPVDPETPPAYWKAEMESVQKPLKPWERPRRTRAGRYPTLTAESSDQNISHIRNFYECLKSRQLPASDIEIGHRSSSACMLANLSLRTGRTVVWDAAKETIAGDAEASALLWREPRTPWTL